MGEPKSRYRTSLTPSISLTLVSILNSTLPFKTYLILSKCSMLVRSRIATYCRLELLFLSMTAVVFCRNDTVGEELLLGSGELSSCFRHTQND